MAGNCLPDWCLTVAATALWTLLIRCLWCFDAEVLQLIGQKPVKRPMTSRSLPSCQAHPTLCYRPVISPEHGVYVVLAVSFLIGAAAAQTWNLNTTLAVVCAFFGFQAEHPLGLHIKQRRSWKPRLLVWAGLYGGLAALTAGWLYWRQGLGMSPLLLIYAAALLALGIDAIAIYRRGQKSIANELITFGAVCLAAPLAYGATTGTITPTVWGLWALGSLYFSSSIFTVKLRKPHKGEPAAAPWRRAIAYHLLAPVLVAGLYGVGLLPPVPALAFSVVLVKFGAICLGRDWFRSARIGPVAALETTTAFLFGAIVMVALLPIHGGG